MTRGVARDAALAAAPARKGRRAGQPVQPREISLARTRRAVLTAIRSGNDCYTALTSTIGQTRTVIGRNRHRARKAKCASTFPRAGPEGHRHPHRRSRHHHGQQPSLTSANTLIRPDRAPAGPWNRPSPGTTRRPLACPRTETTHSN